MIKRFNTKFELEGHLVEVNGAAAVGEPNEWLIFDELRVNGALYWPWEVPSRGAPPADVLAFEVQIYEKVWKACRE